MKDIVVRKCYMEDLALVTQLDREIFGCDGYSYLTVRQLYNVCSDFLYVAAAPQNEIVGYILGCPKFLTTDAWIFALAIRSEWRCKGIAKNLMLTLLDKLTGSGLATVYLTVKPENKVAIHLYSGLGFHPIACEENYFGSGATRLIMQRIL